MTATVLEVDLDDDIELALRPGARTWDVKLERVTAGAMPQRLEGRADVLAVLVGRVPDPVRTAQRSYMIAPGVTVLLIADAAACDLLDQQLRFAPFIGSEVRCVRSHPVDRLVDIVRDSIDASRRRLGFQRTIAALNRQLSDATPSSSRAAVLLDRLLEIAPIGVIVCHRDGLVQAANPCAENLLGVTEAQLLGSPLFERFSAADRPRLLALITLFDSDVSAPPRDVFTIEHGARRVHVELTGARLPEGAGGPSALVLLHDVTERVELVAEMRTAHRRKDEFLAMLGHELRNPLAPIRTAVDLMRMSGAAVFERERAIIARQVDHLTKLVDDLLDVSRITRGKLELALSPLRVGEFVELGIDMASPLIEQRRHTLTVEIPEGLDVEGDRRRLAQVVSNLLTNAAKYTEPGGRITISGAQEGGQIVLRVRDTGRGIATELLPYVFDLFVQAPQSLDRREGGLGLGLAIVKGLVEAHHGSVSVSSTVGVGSEFVVTLPAVRHEAAKERERGIAAGIAHPVRTILVVDDNTDAADLLADSLAAAGYATMVAYDGPAALKAAQTRAPDVALLDIGLPGMDGFELAQRLAALPGLAHLPRIAITGYGQPHDIERTRAAGFFAHLVKPLNLERLCEAIEAVFHQRASNQATN